MGVQSTSKQAYSKLNDLGSRQRQVFNAINDLGSACNLEISKEIKKPINSVTGRTNELVSKGIVEESYKALCETGRTVIYWTLTEKGEKLLPPKHPFRLFGRSYGK